MTQTTVQAEALAAGNAAKTARWRKRAIARVAAWRLFIKAENAAYSSYQAGDITHSEWSALWAAAPPTPSKAEYEAATS